MLAFVISIISAAYIIFAVHLSGIVRGFDFGSLILAFAGAAVFLLSFLASGKIIKNRRYSINDLSMIFFIVFIGVFLFGSAAGMNITGKISEREKRVLAEFPRHNPFHERFPEEFNKYMDDRVGLRERACWLYGFVRPYMLDGVNIKRTVIVGKKDWLFYNGDYDTVANYQGLIDFGPEHFRELKKHIDRLKDFCRLNGIDIYFVMPPNKATVYPEFYPDFIKRLEKPASYRLIGDYIKEHTDISFIDMLDEFEERKKEYSLFYKEDTHWTSVGAYFAYAKLASAIKKDHPSFEPVEPGDLYRCDAKSDKHDLTDMLAAYGYKFPVTNEFCIKDPVAVETIVETDPYKHIMGHYKTSNTGGLKIMLFHDSFMGAMKPFIYEGASEVKSVWFYKASPLVYEKEIVDYKPDIIVWQILEKYVPYIMDGDIRYEELEAGKL